MKSQNDLSKYSKHFNEFKLFNKILKYSEKIGKNMIFSILILYYLITKKDIPFRTRLVFIAALGYFILPTDLIADFLPGIGFTDDLSFIIYAITQGTDHITDEIKEKAKNKLERIFSNDNSKITSSSLINS